MDACALGLFHDGQVTRQDVGPGDGGDVHGKDIGVPVRIASHAFVALMLGIGDLIAPRLVGSGQNHVTAVGIQLEVGVQLRDGIEFVAPDDEIAVGGDDSLCQCLAFADLILLRLCQVIAQVHAFHIDGTVGGVVEFHPVVVFPVVVDKDAIGGTHFVDADRREPLCDFLLVGEWGEAGHKRQGIVSGQVHHSLRGDDSLGGGAYRGEEFRCPVLVAGCVFVVVDFDGNDVAAALEQRRREFEGACQGGVIRVTGRETVKVDIAAGHVEASGLFTVDIDHETVVHLVVQQEHITARWGGFETDGLAEVGGGVLPVRVVAVTDGGLHACHFIAQGCLTR